MEDRRDTDGTARTSLANQPEERLRLSVSEAALPLAPEDFYYEGANLVFTAAYHCKRGYCCNSGCRHCPFGKNAEA